MILGPRLSFFFQRAQAALQAVNAVQSGGLALTGAPATESGLPPGQSSVLRIIVENLFYPVTLEVLHQVSNSAQNHDVCSVGIILTIHRILVANSRCWYFKVLESLNPQCLKSLQVLSTIKMFRGGLSLLYDSLVGYSWHFWETELFPW